MTNKAATEDSEKLAPFEMDHVYYLATPYNCYGGAMVLLMELNKFEDQFDISMPTTNHQLYPTTGTPMT